MTDAQGPARTTPGSWVAPEPVIGPAPGVEFAGHGARLVAYIVDTLIQGILSLGLFVVSLIAAAVFPPLALLGVLCWIAIAIAYFPYYWATRGQTPGMKMMGIRVVRDADGGPITAGQAFLRLVGYWVSGFVLYLGYIWIFIDHRRRGWHDLIAGTVVVKDT
jgi:uncharacterized RDD family membrane protein YckC